ncbi:hypothetical protein M0805_005799 [Coniferiporia weirii]|nr:hypothetical protein M0805_005799 [Coniferiporia weirii]
MAGSFIVVFKDGVTSEQIEKYAEEVNSNGGQVYRRFDTLLNGFAATIPEQLLTQFSSLQGSVVDYIEPDQVVTTQ